jgi:phosphoribosylformylglycinamidine synthase subunit PurL
MGDKYTETIKIKNLNDDDLYQILGKNQISLKLDEAKKAADLIGRNPTLTELHIFNIQWSEHSSYKSSRAILSMLPTKASNVILGPVEDSGIVELGIIGGERYGIVVSHESHNHPSQIVPYEGAATGVGGILRDVLCMGAKILATADPLRFGNPNGKNKNHVKYIANEVIDGIAGYGNAVGIPNIAGDIYFNDSFDENCLVNVVSLGVVKEKDIIHSYAPKDAEGFDIIFVGKPTDNSGFGGAAFASIVMDKDEKETNKGAVQVPDPFLKNVIIRATYNVFSESRKQKINLGFKDMGAGGIMCATSELCSDSEYGAKIDLDKVPISMDNLPPYVILCSETQERFVWICPRKFTKTLLKIYNEDFALSTIADKAQAIVIGEVTKKKSYLVKHKGKIVCDVPIQSITQGIRYQRKTKEKFKSLSEPILEEPKDYNDIALRVLGHPNVASKEKCFKHYDRNVFGNTVIESGLADSGLLRAVPGSKYGIAVTVDSNPRYGRISPYHGAINAVAESMRNVAAIGAVPSALTDCLNYGNPEDEEQFSDFVEGVKGIKIAAENLYQKGSTEPVPVISGNVSFYNSSSNGSSIDPSAIIACIGTMKDFEKSITLKIKEIDSTLLLIGDRKNELGGSVYYEVFGKLGKNIPIIDFKEHRDMTNSIIDSIENELILSCHDISDGGIFVTIAEMILGGEANGIIGAEINIENTILRSDNILFSESPGFVVEVKNLNVDKVISQFKKYNLNVSKLGTTTKNKKLIFKISNKKIIDLSVEQLKQSWTGGFTNALK